MAGSTPRGMRRASSMASSQSDPAAASSPVTPALVASVTCSVPPDSVQATQVSTVPKHRSRDCGRGRPCRGAWRAWWPTRWGPLGCPGPAAPGTCPRCAGPASRCPGPTGSPRGAVPHDGRAPAGWRSPPRRRDRAPPARRRPPRARPSPWRAASNSTKPGRGRGRQHLRRSGRGRWPRRASTTPARTPEVPDVDDEDAAHGHRDLAEGGGQPELPRVEDAPGVEGLLQADEHVEGAAEGVGQEAAPVDAHAVVVADGTAVGRAPRP